jgi:hypothetical protein
MPATGTAELKVTSTLFIVPDGTQAPTAQFAGQASGGRGSTPGVDSSTVLWSSQVSPSSTVPSPQTAGGAVVVVVLVLVVVLEVVVAPGSVVVVVEVVVVEVVAGGAVVVEVLVVVVVLVVTVVVVVVTVEVVVGRGRVLVVVVPEGPVPVASMRPTLHETGSPRGIPSRSSAVLTAHGKSAGMSAVPGEQSKMISSKSPGLMRPSSRAKT